MAEINWTKKALKQLSKLPRQDAQKIFSMAGTLENWPIVRQVKALVNREDYRLRVGNYRIFFTVDESDNIVIITIERVERRNEHTYN